MKFVLVGYKIDETNVINPIYEVDVLYYGDIAPKDIPTEWRLHYNHIELYKHNKIYQRGLP